MDFIDNLTAAGRDVAVKAKDTAEILKWRTKIGLEKDKMSKTYEEIGRIFVQINAESPSEEYFELYAKLGESRQLIEQYEDEIVKIRRSSAGNTMAGDMIICPYCGGKIEAESIYCPKCGKNIYK